MGPNASGAGFSWLGRALMQLAAGNREKKREDALMALQDRRYNDSLARDDRMFGFQQAQADVAGKRYEQERTDRLALLDQQRKDTELARNQQRYDQGYRMTAGPVAGPRGVLLPSLKRDPKLSTEYQDAEAALQLRRKYPEPRQPAQPQLVQTTTGFAWADPNTRTITADPSGVQPASKAGGTNADANIDNALATMETLSKNPSAAGDVAFGYAFIKLLDPTSVVREGELALLSKAKGLRTTVEQQIKRAQTGESLTPQQRADYLNQARAIVQARKQMQMGGFAPATSQLPGGDGEASLSDADLWEKKRREGLDPDAATDYVRNRAR